MADIPEDFKASNNSQTVNFHLSLAARVSLSVYVCFLMFLGIIANGVLLLMMKQNPRMRRAAGYVPVIYITILNLLNCCLLNSFSLAAIFNEQTRQSVLFCKLYLGFSNMFMKMFALALVVCSITSTIELVSWTLDRKRLRLGTKLSLVASSLLVIVDSSPLYTLVNITAEPTCFLVRDGNPVRVVLITESMIIIILPFLSCIFALVITVKKIRETKSKVAVHLPKRDSPVDKRVSSKEPNIKGTDLKSFPLVGASHSTVSAENKTSLHSLPSAFSSNAMSGGHVVNTTSNIKAGPTTAWRKTNLEDSAKSVGEAKNCLINLCCCRQFNLREEVRLIRLVFFVCLTLIVSWLPGAVMIGGSRSSSPTFLDYILIRVSYLTTIHPSVVPLAFLYTNKHFAGGFVAFFRSLRNRKT